MKLRDIKQCQLLFITVSKYSGGFTCESHSNLNEDIIHVFVVKPENPPRIDFSHV